MSRTRLEAQGASKAWVAATNVVATGWGSGATVALASNTNDSRGQIQVTVGTTPSANPTLACTFADSVGLDDGCVVVVSRADAAGNAAGQAYVTAQSATGFTITFVGTPTAAQVVKINYVVVG